MVGKAYLGQIYQDRIHPTLCQDHVYTHITLCLYCSILS